MNKALQTIMRAISEKDEDLDVQKTRNLMNLKALNPFKRFYRTLDYKVYNEDHEVPVRIYFPTEESLEKADVEPFHVLLFFHGGGFATESVESYNHICWNLSKHTNHVVVSVDYRLAPEHRFPTQVEDCYAVAKAIFTDQTFLHVKPENVTIIGDSAGGNLTAVICQMARDRGEFSPARQILIYPCTNGRYEDDCGFASVIENGRDYLLTQKNLKDYMNLYQGSEADRDNPYFAPLRAKDFANLPSALIITAQYDPLRDEGEAYAEKLRAAGTKVQVHRIADTVHGFFLLPPLYPAVKETYEYINQFLGEVSKDVSREENKMAQSGEYC